MRPAKTEQHFDEAARVVHRLAVLVGAGVPLARAWTYLDGEIAERVRDAAVAGRSASDELARESDDSWRLVAATIGLAESQGAPIARVLTDLASGLRGRAEHARALGVQLAGPKATAALVLALPLVGIALGFALDVNPIGVLFANPVGIAALLLGLGLIALAWVWSRALVRGAARSKAHAGLLLELTSVALRGGGSSAAARQSAEQAIGDASLPPPDEDELGLVGEVLDLAQRAGVPAAGLLAAEAAAERGRERQRAAAAAERLGVTLMLPLGVCILPAFGLLAVVPLVIAMLGRTLGVVGW